MADFEWEDGADVNQALHFAGQTSESLTAAMNRQAFGDISDKFASLYAGMEDIEVSRSPDAIERVRKFGGLQKLASPPSHVPASPPHTCSYAPNAGLSPTHHAQSHPSSPVQRHTLGALGSPPHRRSPLSKASPSSGARPSSSSGGMLSSIQMLASSRTSSGNLIPVTNTAATVGSQGFVSRQPFAALALPGLHKPAASILETAGSLSRLHSQASQPCGCTTQLTQQTTVVTQPNQQQQHVRQSNLGPAGIHKHLILEDNATEDDQDMADATEPNSELAVAAKKTRRQLYQ